MSKTQEARAKKSAALHFFLFPLNNNNAGFFSSKMCRLPFNCGCRYVLTS